MSFGLIGTIIYFIMILAIIGTIDYRLRAIEANTRSIDSRLGQILTEIRRYLRPPGRTAEEPLNK